MTTVTVIEEPASYERAVRFDNECILIPEPPHRSKMPRLVTKSYSLPLWKRRGGEGSGEAVPDSPVVDDYVGFKVSVPRFTTKSPSPTREEFVPQSCLVSMGSPPRSAPPQPQPRRRASLPPPMTPVAVTVPLRSCCPDCEPIWEESLKEGEDWKEKFTKAARRRRNSSSDAPRAMLHNYEHHPSKGARPSSPFAGIMSIRVDEVDYKRSSGESHRSAEKRAEPEASKVVPAVPIKEEDEDQLFPLPSPRRSPSVSPAPSPSGSSSSLPTGGATSEFAEAASRQKYRSLLTPARTTLWSPPSPTSPISGSHSAPLPTRNISPLSLPSSTDFLEADKLAFAPAFSRSSTTTSISKKSKSNPFTKAGSGILKGMISLGSPPGI